MPIDAAVYEEGDAVSVPGNTGNLQKDGNTFAGWCLNPDGTGESYAAGGTVAMDTTDVILYARWTLNPTYTVTYDGNGADSGAVPVDAAAYEEGELVTVPGNARGMEWTLDGLAQVFTGWNTLADGSGTAYAQGQTFVMGTENIVLYAVWVVPYVLPTTSTDIDIPAQSVLVDGDKAFTTTYSGTTFKVFDVGDPQNPQFLGSVNHGYGDLRVEAHAIHDDIVWCARSSSGSYGLATGVFGVDVSDPAAPVVRGALTLKTGTSLISSASLIYSGYLLVHDYSDNLIYVIDIGDPDAPALYSFWSVPNMVNGGPGMMLIEDDLLYLPCGENRTLRIYDLSDLENVVELGSASTTNECQSTAVKIGSYIYTTVANAIKVFDVSDPSHPILAGTVTGLPTGRVKTRNGRLFSFDYDSPTVRVYSLADPTAPVIENSSTVPVPAPSTNLALYQMALSSADWVGDYLIGMTYGSQVQYHGPRALDFTVN